MSRENVLNIIKTAHIHLDHAVFRVHCKDVSALNFDAMNEDDRKPDAVHWVGKSSDKSQNRQSFLLQVGEDYDLEQISDWINHFDKAK